VNQKRGAAIHARLEQLNTLLGRHPALHHHIIQLLAQELVYHILMLAAHFDEVRQCAHRRHALRQRARLQQPPDGVGGVAVVANQR